MSSYVLGIEAEVTRKNSEKYYVPLKKFRKRITSPKTIEETSGPVNLKTQLNNAKL
jgi:hypothetical protein